MNQHNIHIAIPANVDYVLKQLMKHGHEAYAVGGCVRDSLLDREPGDWDITTSALPEQVKEIFSHTIDTGIAHGTVTVMLDHIGYEVTTYRVDGEYKDNRHPEQVSFTRSLIEDLKRRDFTINAMAYNPACGIVDEFDGMGDLEKKVIRCVGDAKDRFDEDALRILRAVRFSAQLGFEVEAQTIEGIKLLAPNLVSISKERIQVELDKMLRSPHPEYMKLLYETGISKVILPWWDDMMETEQNNPYHCYNVGEHTLVAMQSVRADHYLRWAALLHDVGKPKCKTTDEEGIDHFYGHQEAGCQIAEEILRELRWDNKTINIVTRLVKWHDYQIHPSMRGVRRSLLKVGNDIYPYLLEIKKADMLAQSDYKRQERAEQLTEIGTYYERVLEQQQCFSLKDMAVTGKDLIQAGMPAGKQLGGVLQQLLEWVIEHPEDNKKDILLEKCREWRQ